MWYEGFGRLWSSLGAKTDPTSIPSWLPAPNGLPASTDGGDAARKAFDQRVHDGEPGEITMTRRRHVPHPRKRRPWMAMVHGPDHAKHAKREAHHRADLGVWLFDIVGEGGPH